MSKKRAPSTAGWSIDLVRIRCYLELPDVALALVFAVLESAVVLGAAALVAMGFACFAEVFVIETYSGMH